jgi:hypothetical protein
VTTTAATATTPVRERRAGYKRNRNERDEPRLFRKPLSQHEETSPISSERILRARPATRLYALSDRCVPPCAANTVAFGRRKPDQKSNSACPGEVTQTSVPSNGKADANRACDTTNRRNLREPR